MTKVVGENLPSYCGTRIRGLRQLQNAVEGRRAVVVPDSYSWSKPRPAAVLMNQSGHSLYWMFCVGMYIYNTGPQEKDEKEMR